MASITLPPVAGPGARVYDDRPAGVVDGANTTFTTSNAFRLGTQRVLLNGVVQALGPSCDYTVSESGGPGTGYDTIVFSFPPIATDSIAIDYTQQ